MKKTAVLLLLSLLLAAVPVAASAEQTGEETQPVILREPGYCGEELTWHFSGDTLTISGNGAMDDYPDGEAPWFAHREQICRVVIQGNVTNVGDGAFTDYDSLQAVDFGPAMHTVGVAAFKSCDGLTAITLPDTFRRFGKESFMGCSNLTEIVCRGGMPSFNENCVWDVYATVFYPAHIAWPEEHVLQLTQAFQNRIQFRAGDGNLDQSVFQTTEQTLPAQTEAVTEAATEPVQTQPQQVQTQPVPTVAMTEPEQTQAPVQTVQTQPEVQTEETETQPLPEETVPEKKTLGSMSGIVVCAVLFSAVFSFLLIGALVFRRRRC